MEAPSATEIALAAASAMHAGFQLVVTVVVYPALADIDGDRWATAHRAHSRRIGAAVLVVYPVVAAACLWVVASGPHAVLPMVAVVGNALAALVTAAAAAPTHRRLGREGPVPVLVRRLLVVDRIRLAGAGMAAVTAILALAT